LFGRTELLTFLILFWDLNQFLAAADDEATSIYDDLQATLSSLQREMASFARELRQVSLCN